MLKLIFLNGIFIVLILSKAYSNVEDMAIDDECHSLIQESDFNGLLITKD